MPRREPAVDAAIDDPGGGVMLGFSVHSLHLVLRGKGVSRVSARLLHFLGPAFFWLDDLGVLLDGGTGGGLTLRRKAFAAKAVAGVGLTLYVFELIVGCHYSRDRQDFLTRRRFERPAGRRTDGT